MFIGLDIGTSSTKGVLVDTEGTVIATAVSTYDFDRPKPGWSEQDPVAWWQATREVLRNLCSQTDARQIRGLGLSGQMHGCVLLDAASLRDAGSRQVKALRPALMWNDQRTAKQCAEILDRMGGAQRLITLTGNTALTGFTLPKLLWVREHEPEVYDRARCMMMPKDYVRLCLCSEAATDVGDAAGTLLFDVERRVWCREVVDAVQICDDLLPRVHESGAIAGHITKWAAAESGLPIGTPITAGSGDNQCGGIGAGAASAGAIVLTLGTSGVVFAHTDACLRDLDPHTPGRVHTMCSATGNETRMGAWTITGCMLSAAGSLEWARSVLAPTVSFDELITEASTIAPGCDGLMFLPHLTGERCPHPDPHARGAWVGLSRSHTRGHLVRAVLEGVSFTLAQVLELVLSLGIEAREVRIGGGGARSMLWRQITADIIGRPIVTLANDEGPAHGASLLAAVSGGAFSSIPEACNRAVRAAASTNPSQNSPHYASLHERYASLYPALADYMHQ